MLHLVFYSLLTTMSFTQLYDPALYSPDSNIIINPTFSTPDIGGALFQIYSGSFLGWSFVDAQVVTLSTVCSNFGNTCIYNNTQGLDLDLFGAFEMISQSVLINSTNQYLLSIGWLEPMSNPIGKSF